MDLSVWYGLGGGMKGGGGVYGGALLEIDFQGGVCLTQSSPLLDGPTSSRFICIWPIILDHPSGPDRCEVLHSIHRVRSVDWTNILWVKYISGRETFV